ncbi:5-formyltetrahydrofolate cyclo-ligase [Lactobacillus sp. YT155]|uniref:5-formyltetrahydrofolate cyclo-ligase n=1 Tax=Lactobacillus sp. YT155 TaxID=3060955 RepID=UPI00265FCB58|nr:5-formyltetrahydrofolate cyclo-ligase [Lactobacillus sp. YT155]MDO1605577.1 5-formyltetrahydrofolate cyclo-ligase [Lactobacillus sp. YT155]
MDKKTFRKKQIQQLDEFSKTEKFQEECDNIYHNLFSNESFKKASSIAVTWSVGFEINTQPIIDEIVQKGKKVFLPKIDLEIKQMHFYQYTDVEELEETSFNILQPKGTTQRNDNVDLIIVPGLAFSKADNYRLGFGGGFYDRFLEKSKSPTISLATSKHLYDKAQWDIDSFDISIKQIITSEME